LWLTSSFEETKRRRVDELCCQKENQLTGWAEGSTPRVELVTRFKERRVLLRLKDKQEKGIAATYQRKGNRKGEDSGGPNVTSGWRENLEKWPGGAGSGESGEEAACHY